MAATEGRPTDRVIWVGTSRRGHFRPESDQEWRERLAQEMSEACDELASQGLRLASIVRVSSSRAFWGGWTEGAWLHFTRAE